MDNGIYNYETFTVGHITAEKFIVKCLSDISYSGKDTVSIIAIGY